MTDDRFDERTSHVVGQAAEMVAAQADCDVIEAFDRLKARAAALHQSLETTALDVIDGVLHFRPDTPGLADLQTESCNDVMKS